MASNLASPIEVEVASTINFHEVISALCLFANKYPVERVSQNQIDAIRAIADVLEARKASEK